MPLDPTIALQVQRPQLRSSGDSMMRALQLRSLMDDRQLRALQMREAEQGLSDREATRQAARDAGGDYGKFLDVYSEIDPLGGMKARSEYAKTQTETETAQLEQAQKKLNVLGQLIGAARDPASYAIAREQAVNLLGLDPRAIPEQYDPRMVQQAMQQTLTAKQQIDMALQERQFSETQRHNRATEANSAAGRVPSGYQPGPDGGLAPIPGGPNDPNTKPVNVVNIQFPDGSVKGFADNDRAGISAALQSGGVEQGAAKAAGPQLSGKEAQTAKSKIQTAKLLRQQLADARAKFDAIKDSFSAGPGGGLLPTEAGQGFDAAVDALRSTVSALTRVPGVGAMSDYETRLDQAKIPSRGKYEKVTEQQLQQLEDMARFIEEGYSDMLGPTAPAAPAETSWKDL